MVTDIRQAQPSSIVFQVPCKQNIRAQRKRKKYFRLPDVLFDFH